MLRVSGAGSQNELRSAMPESRAFLAKFFSFFVSFVCFCKTLLVAALPRQALALKIALSSEAKSSQECVMLTDCRAKMTPVLCFLRYFAAIHFPNPNFNPHPCPNA